MEWRIFFIGPMGSAELIEGSTERIDYSLHLPKLHEYLVDYLMFEDERYGWKLKAGNRRNGATLEKGDEKIITSIPSNLYGPYDIPTTVFGTIDDSDLIIADLSGNRPSVVYELAFSHALGIRTILVGDPKTTSFYFSHERITYINFDNQISSVGLNGAIDSWLIDKNKRFDSVNPLTRVYGAPLPDISAATGLGAGFFDNFALPILANGKIVEKVPDGKGGVKDEISELKGLIVLRPENLEQSVSEMDKKLGDHLISCFPVDEVKRGDEKEIFIRLKGDAKRTPFFLVRGYMIDIPRTMFSLSLSPRLEFKQDSLRKSNMEQVLIEHFFEAVKRFLNDKKLKNLIEKEKFHFGSIEEIPKIIETGKSRTWA